MRLIAINFCTGLINIFYIDNTFFLNIYICMCMNLYIQNNYAQYTHIAYNM